MGLVREIKIRARNFVDWFSCKDLHSKANLGHSHADNWFVLTDRLKDALVYSGGVGKDIYFEQALARDYNCKILMFDPSPTGIATVRSLKLPSNIRFFDYGLAGSDSKFNFGTPLNPQEGSYTVGENSNVSGEIQFECRSVASLAEEHNHFRIELLKIDIEGFEYDVLDDILNSNLIIRQILVEFHDFYKNIPKQKTTDCIAKLKKHGYTLYHKRGHDYSFVKLSD